MGLNQIKGRVGQTSIIIRLQGEILSCVLSHWCINLDDGDYKFLVKLDDKYEFLTYDKSDEKTDGLSS